jgi:putative tryptophan/tyrosine transport system substrate-binding protein
MKRREFVAFLGGAVSACPLGALAQQRDHPRRIGVLMGFAETDEVWQTYLRVFRERLRDFGWTDGQNIKFEYRFAGKSVERTRQAAAELVGSKPDMLFVTTNPALSALLKETRTIPIVFTWVSESVGSGYVSSLAHPGGNVTGFHNFEPRLEGNGWAFSSRLRRRFVGWALSTFRRLPPMYPLFARPIRFPGRWA